MAAAVSVAVLLVFIVSTAAAGTFVTRAPSLFAWFELDGTLHGRAIDAAPAVLLPLHSLGMSNRFRTLAAAHQFAASVGRDLWVSWMPTRHINATFEPDLFAPGTAAELGFRLWPPRRAASGALQSARARRRKQALLQTLLERVVGPVRAGAAGVGTTTVDVSDHLTRAWHGFGGHGSAFDVLWHRHWRRRLDPAVLTAPDRLIVLMSDGDFLLPGQHCADALHRKRTFYAGLRGGASAAVRAIVARTERAHRLRDRLSVGVHVRRDDAGMRNGGSDWPTVMSQRGGAVGERLGFDEAAPLPAFARLLREVRAHFPASPAARAAGRGLAVVAASNDAAALRELAALVGGGGGGEHDDDDDSSGDNSGSLVTVDDGAGALRGVRGSPAGMQLALAEWILLSRTSLVIHTHGSTFGQEAALIDARPSLRVASGKAVLVEPVPHARFCGDLVLERSEGGGIKTECVAFSGVGIDGELPEKPEVRCHETAVLRKRCDRATQGWGVTNVFC